MGGESRAQPVDSNGMGQTRHNLCHVDDLDLTPNMTCMQSGMTYMGGEPGRGERDY